ncbi:MAG: protein-glutamate O-methyltransferase CheR [Candidatus Hydrogenedentes bacterium]|nr:protein-glutamate O-methyltransferase CheR [Candidatus Hydrogenedentota bacterium]
MNAAAPTRDEMTAWSRHIHEICGIYLDDTKAYLVETRLGPLLRETGAGGWAELLYKVKTDAGNTLRTKVVSAITTNETSFFRDTSPFELLQHKLFPELIDRRNKAGVRPVPIRILSAACSTGQEVYSTAIVLKELLGDFKGYDVRILGLDISDAAVAQASYAHFTRLELDRGMTPDKLARYFEPSGDRWKVRDELRALATFRRANLLEPIANATPFDIIFCRNVAIYFTESDKIRLFKNLGRHLQKDGALIIGSTESIAGLCPEFTPMRYLRAVYYQRNSVAS